MRSLPAILDGQQFASRTEARWPKFWGALGVRWLYEPEVIELEGNPPLIYVPDFFLPDMQCWVEIKGTVINDEQGLKTLEKCKRLAMQSDFPVILCYGEPYDPRCACFHGSKMYSDCRWSFCGSCGHIAISFQGIIRCAQRKTHGVTPLTLKEARRRDREIYAAALLARQARFGWPRGKKSRGAETNPSTPV